jgi:hypothetical protein
VSDDLVLTRPLVVAGALILGEETLTVRADAGGTVLVLRTCDKDLRSYGGFQWPAEGEVVAPDWNSEPVCGGGLHGLLWGEGDGALLNWDEDARWLVVEVLATEYVSIDGKVKFPRGTVVFCGDRLEATTYLSEHGGAGRAIVGGTATAGDGGTATAGYGGTATAGYGGTATAGDGGTATAGYGGTATAGDRGTATAGDRGTATAGDRGTATAGDRGTATAGVGGTATAGYGGTATAGDGGTATAGYGGTATAGYGGTVQVRWWDNKAERYRTATGDTGEDGIEPNVAYHVLNGRLVAVPVPAEAKA